MLRTYKGLTSALHRPYVWLTWLIQNGSTTNAHQNDITAPREKAEVVFRNQSNVKIKCIMLKVMGKVVHIMFRRVSYRYHDKVKTHVHGFLSFIRLENLVRHYVTLGFQVLLH